MKNNEEQKHFLVLQALPGDNAIIDISKLEIASGYMPTNLAEIDSFTMSFTTSEIIEAIKEANIVEERYLNGKLCIADNQKHKPIVALTKDYVNNFDIREFLELKLPNKNLMNTLANKFATIVEDDILNARFKKASREKNLEDLLECIFSMPYLLHRKFIVYLIEMYKKELELSKSKKELIRDKAA